MSRCPFLLLLYLLLGLLSQCGLGLASLLVRNVTFHPAFLHDLKADEMATVQVEIAYYYKASELSNLRSLNLTLDASVGEPDIARLGFRSEQLQWDNTALQGGDGDGDAAEKADDKAALSQHLLRRAEATGARLNDDLSAILASLQLAIHRTNLTIDALFLGRTEATLRPRLIPNGPGTKEELEFMDPVPSYPIIVKRSAHARMLNAIFLSTLGCLIILANIMMGCTLDVNAVWNTLRRPVAPGIGFACQFLLMPTVSYALARCLLLPYGLHSLGLGLFTAGCAPGGGGSNFWTVLLNGNADLSITMTAISTIAALAMMPMWMYALGGTFLEHQPGATIRIPYKNILTSLSVLVLPLLIGVAIKKWLPKVAAMISKVMRPFLILIILFILSFGTYANLYMFRLMSWQVLAGGLLLPFIGFWLGCFSALALRMPKADVAAISIETGVQNSGIAIMLLKMSFPEPDGDIGSVVPVVVSIFTPGPLLLGFAVHLLMSCIKKQRGGLCEENPEEMAEDAKPLRNAQSGLTDSFTSTPPKEINNVDKDQFAEATDDEGENQLALMAGMEISDNTEKA